MSVAVTATLGNAALSHRLASHDVPSGQRVELFEVLVDAVGDEVWLRFRFLAKDIGRGEDALSFAQVEADFDHLCNTVALPYMQQLALEGGVIAIAMLNQPLEFGASDGDVTQYVEAFRVIDGRCDWKDLW